MPVRQFPDPRNTTEDGIVALGGDLEPETLMLAYLQGIFPWPISGLPLTWFCPPERGILEWDRLHIPKSLARAKKKNQFHFTVDQEFEKVIRFCAKLPRPGQDGTWITKGIIEAYCELHRIGYAHSIEVWEKDELVGGIYGVESDGAFAGESMFHLKPNASKLGILFLMEYLHSKGQEWLDIQVITPHMEALGARLIPRDNFLKKLAESQKRGVRLFERTP
jgi:leucyl/phenylalanyl-tRNA--protein transferase